MFEHELTKNHIQNEKERLKEINDEYNIMEKIKNVRNK